MMTDRTPLLHDVELLRQHMREKGYVYLPGYSVGKRVIASASTTH